MNNIQFAILFSLCLFLSLNAQAENVYQPSVSLFSSITPNQLWRYTGSGIVKDVDIKEGIVVIETNLGTEDFPQIKTIAYSVRDSNLLESDLVKSSVTFSYYHEDKYDVITNIKH